MPSLEVGSYRCGLRGVMIASGLVPELV